MTSPTRERAEDLLVLRATEGLSPRDARELEDAFADSASWDHDDYELAAAAIQLAWVRPEVMPGPVRQAVEVRARAFFETTENRWPQSAMRPRTVVPLRRRWPSFVAAAAVVAVALLGWQMLRSNVEPGLQQQREQLIASSADLITVSWTATEDPASRGATGDVVWSDAQQTGFMRFSGLSLNDPSVTQYQLWIFDSQRDERYPVDGGVFDIPSEGEVIVPIRAKLFVEDPSLFAVTVERPGGVVVSSRERIVVLAQPGEDRG